MPPEPLAPEFINRYLSVLGVSRRPPSPQALAELVAAQVTRIPFENISKLYYMKHLGFTGLPSLQMFLAGIEQYHFGGTCYSNNFYLYRLLTSLGYETKLCGADMTNPDVHMVSIVQLDSREYLVDAGYAAPFLAPLPRDLGADYAIMLGRDRYVLKPQDAEGRSQLELYRDGVAKHGYRVKPAPRKIEDFQQVIADSFRASATFMNSVLLARFYPNRSVVIHNLTRIESQGTSSTMHSLENRDALIAQIEEHFGIPPNITAEAVGGLGLQEDAWA
ncbi:MAG: arylamine N-acetyltransferase [Acidobacteriia bacterium]|nr:arylamine N-acetyltransferase [Terriglobia bacterium]